MHRHMCLKVVLVLVQAVLNCLHGNGIDEATNRDRIVVGTHKTILNSDYSHASIWFNPTGAILILAPQLTDSAKSQKIVGDEI